MSQSKLSADGFTANLSQRILEDESIISGFEGTLYANRQDDRSLSYSMIAYDILERFNPSLQASILEVCCGAGHLAHYLYKHSRNKNITATDGSTELIKAAQKRYAQEPIRFEVQNVINHAYQKQSDIVVCMDSFHHFPDPIPSLKHLLKLVKDGGNLYIIDLARNCPIDLIQKRQKVMKNPHEQKRLLRSINASFTNIEMEANLALAGTDNYQVIYPRKFSEANVDYHTKWIANDDVKEYLYERKFWISIINNI